MNVGRLFVIISLALFTYSLTQAGYAVVGDVPDNGAPGYMLLLIGWLGPLAGVFAWLANPALLLAWVLIVVKSYRPAIISAAVALALALSFLLNQEIMINEGGTMAEITDRGPGYRWWLASIVAALIGSALGAYDQRSTQPRPIPRHTGTLD